MQIYFSESQRLAALKTKDMHLHVAYCARSVTLVGPLKTGEGGEDQRANNVPQSHLVLENLLRLNLSSYIQHPF